MVPNDIAQLCLKPGHKPIEVEIIETAYLLLRWWCRTLLFNLKFSISNFWCHTILNWCANCSRIRKKTEAWSHSSCNVELHCMQEASTFYQILGLEPSALILGWITPLITISVLFLGPISCDTSDENSISRYDSPIWGDCKAWRDLLIAPILEEWTFRGLLLPVLLQAVSIQCSCPSIGFTSSSAHQITPMYGNQNLVAQCRRFNSLAQTRVIFVLWAFRTQLWWLPLNARFCIIWWQCK